MRSLVKDSGGPFKLIFLAVIHSVNPQICVWWPIKYLQQETLSLNIEFSKKKKESDFFVKENHKGKNIMGKCAFIKKK